MKLLVSTVLFGFVAVAFAQHHNHKGSAKILASDSDVRSDSYKFNFETDNGIRAEEQGQESDGIEAQGGYTYTGDDGQVYSVTFAAGQGGFQPQGAHIPTPPPIPEAILKSLELNAAHEAAGIIDDGQYNRKFDSPATPSVAGRQQYRAQASASTGFRNPYRF